MNENKRLIKNTILIAIGNFGSKIISFLLLPLYTTVLATEEYGVYDYIVAMSSFLLPVITMCLQEALFRFIIDYGYIGKDYKKIVTNSFIVIIFNIIIFGIALLLLFLIFDVPYLLYLWIYVAANALYTYSNNLLRGQGRIKEYSILTSAKNILTIVLNVILIAVLNWGMNGLFFSLIISEIMAFLIMLFDLKLWRDISFKNYDKNVLKKMMNYSMPLIPNTLSATIINLSDRVIISLFIGPEANGIYSISYKFPNMVEVIYHYFYTAWSESAARVLVKDKQDAIGYYQTLHKNINNIIFSCVIFIISLMPIAFRIFVRGDYVEGFVYIPFLLFAMYFDSMAKFYSGIYTALKKTNIMAISTIVAACFNIIINVICIKQLGLWAAAASTFIADLILLLIRHYCLKSSINIHWSKKIILVECIVGCCIFFLYDYNDWKKITISIIISLCYFVILNKVMIKNIINKLYSKIKLH